MFTRVVLLCGGFAWLAYAAKEPLRITHLGVQQIEDGPAVDTGTRFVPGETVYARFEVEQFTETKENTVKVSWTVEAVDPKGILVAPPESGVTEATLAPEDNLWRPRIRKWFILPSPAAGGSYAIRVRVKDEYSNETASGETKFAVSAPPMPEAKDLTVGGFGFFRGEDSAQPLNPPVYHVGENLYARFWIAGYRLGRGNAINVSYSVSVWGPDGKLLYKQDPAVEEKSASFYPRAFVETSLSLTMQPGTKGGEYALVVSARDGIGNQTVELRKTFGVE